jgi:hypothetical protein
MKNLWRKFRSWHLSLQQSNKQVEALRNKLAYSTSALASSEAVTNTFKREADELRVLCAEKEFDIRSLSNDLELATARVEFYVAWEVKERERLDADAARQAARKQRYINEPSSANEGYDD